MCRPLIEMYETKALDECTAMQGETVPYIICVEKDSEGNLSGNQKGLAERAHHPEEINAASNLAIDAEYYLTQQVGIPPTHQSCCLRPYSTAHAASMHLSTDIAQAVMLPKRTQLRTG